MLVQAERQNRARKNLSVVSATEIENELRRARNYHKVRSRRGHLVGDRALPRLVLKFKQWVRTLVLESHVSSIAAMFYACDYSTKPNMTCAPVLVSLRDGVQRLDETLREEDEKERLAELEAAGSHAAASAEGVAASDVACLADLAGSSV